MSSLKQFSIVVAKTRDNGIGLDGNLPWPRLPIDMKQFYKITTSTPDENSRNVCIMGRKTWESIPITHRPLKNRINIVVSTTQTNQLDQSDLYFAKSFSSAHEIASSLRGVNSIYIIGGSAIYQAALESAFCQNIFVTEVLSAFPSDTKFPFIPSTFQLSQLQNVQYDGANNFIPIQFLTYTRFEAPKPQDISSLDLISAPSPLAPSSQPQTTSITTLIPPKSVSIPELSGEAGYLSLIKHVIEAGTTCTDRTGIGTRSVFGYHIRYDLRNNSFPLFTTKRTFFRGVVEELLWFVRGCTDSRVLSNNGVKIWDPNSSREFLDSRGLQHREVGDLGPVYGFQWRHFGAEYKDFNADYTTQGFDQLLDVINQLKTNPDSRRIIISAWNPVALPSMALPPCHVLCQFRVYNGGLSCLMFQRSCDLGLGVPFNVASYSLLTIMLAHITNLVPVEFVHFMGDAHVYLNHIEPLQRQLLRTPKEQPTLKIARPYKEDSDDKDSNYIKSIEDFKFEDFILENYHPDGIIKMDMAV